MMKLDFSGKNAIIIGASMGIGKTIAERLLKLNSSVFITSTHYKMPLWSRQYDKCKHIRLILSDYSTIKEFFKTINKLQHIDILVNNVDVQIFELVDDITESAWNKVLQVNLYGPMRLIKCVARKMKKRKKGKILNISSIYGVISKQGSSAYSASKSGLLGLTRASALDLAPHGILVNALCPGYTQTEMMNSVSQKQQRIFRDTIPLRRFAKTDEIANFALFLCSDLNTYITGQTVVVDGGVTIQ